MHYELKFTLQMWLIQTGQMCFSQFLFPLINLINPALGLTDLFI